MKKRIDILIKEKGLVRSREMAQNLIESGSVKVEGKVIRKPSKKIDVQSEIEIGSLPKYVSRGGEKLEKALEEFAVDVKGLTVIDVGASTGGFTDCLLQKGTSHVYAVDVGTLQLDESLKNDSKVSVYENTDIRKLGHLPKPADLAVIDVSFISLTLVLSPVKELLKPKGEIIALIKPQFETENRGELKKGIVKSEEDRKKTVEKIKEWSENHGFQVLGTTTSPIKGGDGNIEYLIHLKSEK